jgi:hypothetical protein
MIWREFFAIDGSLHYINARDENDMHKQMNDINDRILKGPELRHFLMQFLGMPHKLYK